jgi:hypothetical protein|tara:strand:+ start:52 stop:540 length:489 start_codon:yes stop_codon:yes gene_type:complete
MKQVALISLVIILLQGCATPYQAVGFRGGYSETQLDTNVFKVSFRGNGFTSRERTTDFTLLRSAQLALNNGFKYFAIIDENTYVRHSTYTTPTQSQTTGSVRGYGNTAYVDATTTTTGGHTYNFSKPSSSNTIVCFVEKPQNVRSYSAVFIINSIVKKYDLK